MSAYPEYPGNYYPQPTVTTSSNSGYTIGVIALILAIIAIVIIVVIAVIFYRDSVAVGGLIKGWTLETASTTSPAAFTGGPNVILEIPSGIAAGYTVNIAPYTGIDTVVTGTSTSIFKISNNQSNNDVTVAFPNGSIQAWTNANPVGTIAKGTTAEFVWITTTSIQRLS